MREGMWWKERKGKLPHLTSHVELISHNEKQCKTILLYLYYVPVTKWAAMGGKPSAIGGGRCLD